MIVNIECRLITCRQYQSKKGKKYYKALFCTPDANAVQSFIFDELNEDDVKRLEKLDLREFVVPDDITLTFRKERKEE